MFGFACDETPELMPAPIRYAHRLIEVLREHLESGEIDYLRPDAKSQVTIEYDDDDRPQSNRYRSSSPASIRPDVSHDQLRKDVIERVIRPSAAQPR